MKDFVQSIKDNASCYIYDLRVIETKCQELTTQMPDFEYLYSVKTNPHTQVLKTVKENNFGADAASSQEVFKAIEAGIGKSNIYYSSPGKTEADINGTIDKCILIADSINEVALINKVAENKNTIAEIGIRINPDFTMNGKALLPSKFGIDVEQIRDVVKLYDTCKNVKITGVHFHIRSQVLNEEELIFYYQQCYSLSKKLGSYFAIKFINFGSGIGAVYNSKDKALNLEKLNKGIENIVADNANSLKAKLIIESGRFIVCNAGNYYLPILDIKQSRGVKYVIVPNGLNGFLRPAIANLICKVSTGEVGGYEPLFTSFDAFEFEVLNNNNIKEKVSIVGNLCTALDVLAESVEVNCPSIGDIVKITNAGSYAYSLSPLFFSSQDMPKELFIDKLGVLKE